MKMRCLLSFLATIAILGCHGEQASAPGASATATTTATAAVTAIATSTGTATATATSTAIATGTATDAPAAWSFDADPVGGPPARFSFGRTGGGKPGSWVIKAEPGAPSGANVLAQIDADSTDFRFPVAVADAPSLRDVRLSVRCKPVSGSVDQACGLVFRYRDENNYYLTRANALENNVRFYTVKDGHRKQLEGWNGAVTSKAWHELRADARGDRFEVYWDGKKVIDGRDSTFPDAGKVGVWTKADSVTYFDELSATPL